MRVLHTIESIAERAGGPARSSQGLVAALNALDVEAWLFSFAGEERPFLNGVTHFRSAKGGGRRALEELVEEIRPDLIHVHCLWAMSSHAACAVARRKDIPYLVAPRGMLEPWSLEQKKWKKRLAMWLYQRRDLEGAAALHATADSEADQFRLLGFRQPVVVSPNGVAFPDGMPPRGRRADGKRTLLFLSRIHPKKGLMELIEAWKRCEQEKATAGWHVEYAGPDYGGHLAEVQGRIRDLGLEKDFAYLGNLDDRDKWAAYRRADLFALPTYSENFGIVIAEALFAEVPVITTRGTPWSELEGNAGGRCGWWIDIGMAPLVEALKESMRLGDHERAGMGVNGRLLVERNYAWPAVGRRMKQAYEQLLGEQGPAGPFRMEGDAT